MIDQSWYIDGLQFECRQCGKCCAGSPGQVWITEEELDEIASYLGIDNNDFRQDYTEEIEGRGRCLNERANYDCIFYNRKQGCVIYQFRPRQCRTWPFWSWNLETRERWYYASMDCKGIGKGRLFSVDEITESVEDDGLC